MPQTVNSELLQAKGAIAGKALVGVLTAGAVYIGDKVGLYEAMSDAGPLTSHALAERTGLDERFVREWLHQQAASEIVEYRGDGQFELTHEAALVFADVDNPMSRIGQFARFPTTADRFVSAVDAFRSGRGGTFSERMDPEESIRAPLQVWSRTQLVPEALPRLGDVVQRLESGGRAADFGCGTGAAPIAIAKAFPASQVDGYDNWVEALDICEEAKAFEGLSNVRFLNSDEHPMPEEPTYDLVMTMDCLHDMVRPDRVARAIRRSLKPDGSWFIVEIDGHEDFEENLKDPLAAFAYGASLIICLQSSTSEPDGFALGTLGLPEPRLRELVEGAGFDRLERVEGLEHPFNAYYVARP